MWNPYETKWNFVALLFHCFVDNFVALHAIVCFLTQWEFHIVLYSYIWSWAQDLAFASPSRTRAFAGCWSHYTPFQETWWDNLRGWGLRHFAICVDVVEQQIRVYKAAHGSSPSLYEQPVYKIRPPILSEFVLNSQHVNVMYKCTVRCLSRCPNLEPVPYVSASTGMKGKKKKKLHLPFIDVWNWDIRFFFLKAGTKTSLKWLLSTNDVATREKGSSILTIPNIENLFPYYNVEQQ